jgi:hypothetical protein
MGVLSILGGVMSTNHSAAKEFSRRLNQACDDSPNVPEYGKGRQVVVAGKMDVSQEAVRKWFAGESMPKSDKVKKLADFLEVDRAWLALGEKPELARDEKKSVLRTLDAAVNIVAGTIKLKGANCFAPSDSDPRKDYTDFCAGIRGVMHSIHVTSAREVSGGTFELVVPREFQNVRCVGFLPDPKNLYHLIDMPTDFIERNKVRHAGDFVVTIDYVDGCYKSGKDIWPNFNPLGGVE